MHSNVHARTHTLSNTKSSGAGHLWEASKWLLNFCCSLAKQFISSLKDVFWICVCVSQEGPTREHQSGVLERVSVWAMVVCSGPPSLVLGLGPWREGGKSCHAAHQPPGSGVRVQEDRGAASSQSSTEPSCRAHCHLSSKCLVAHRALEETTSREI